MSNSDESLSRPGNHSPSIDPLVEQMTSILRLRERPTLAQVEAQRPRRFSDPDPSMSNSTTQANSAPATVRSRDGTRWLPAPDTQTHAYSRPSSECAIEDDGQPEPVVQLEQHTCSAAVCAVSKVFDTTELLELVLSHLNTRDILCLRQTSRHWNGVIKVSPELRLNFFYYPQWLKPKYETQLLELSMRGVSIDPGEALYKGQWVVVTMTPEAARKLSPPVQGKRRVRSRSIFEGLRGGLGNRAGEASDSWPETTPPPPVESSLQYGDLFITQPPVVHTQAYMIDRAKQSDASEDIYEADYPAAIAKLHCDAGITLEFLAETAQSLLAKKKGGDERVVMFKTIVSFTTSESAVRKRSHTRGVTSIG